jgi:FtsP/CotA-like multicopper oxidase with cupredoxin domain
MTGLPYPGLVFIGGFGPPLCYNTGGLLATGCTGQASTILGGNPDVTPWVLPPAIPPLAQENGWKDTVIMYPGQVTRIMVRWAPTDLPTTAAMTDLYFPFNPNHGHGYVWHCHIIDHEDNEMMRPTSVQPNSSAIRTITNY